MAYKRGLQEENGRWIPKHSIFEELTADLSTSGGTCDCCPNLGTRRRVFADPLIQTKLSVRSRRFRYLYKRFPGLMRKEVAKIEAWCERTGRDDADWWWQEMLERHYPR